MGGETPGCNPEKFDENDPFGERTATQEAWKATEGTMKSRDTRMDRAEVVPDGKQTMDAHESADDSFDEDDPFGQRKAEAKVWESTNEAIKSNKK